jgi:predicted acetyltransferase
MSHALPRLRVERLQARDHELLRRLYDAYLEELVSFGASYRRRADGRWEYRPPGGDWGPDHLPYWLEEGPEHRVLLLREHRQVVGFAMVGLRPAAWMSPGMDACISEFYVVPTARRRGIGEAAARRIFERWRGRWEVSEVPANAPAIVFWRRTIERFTGGAFREVEVRGGPAQRFDSRSRRTTGSGPRIRGVGAR